jgi:hypothetical protein
MLLGIALLIGYMNRGAGSARFARLQQGMTMEEVLLVLQPRTTVDLFSTGDGPEPPPKIVIFHFTEDSMFPGFDATLTFESGRLTNKELNWPTLQDCLHYWWVRFRYRG